MAGGLGMGGQESGGDGGGDGGGGGLRAGDAAANQGADAGTVTVEERVLTAPGGGWRKRGAGGWG